MNVAVIDIKNGYKLKMSLKLCRKMKRIFCTKTPKIRRLKKRKVIQQFSFTDTINILMRNGIDDDWSLY